MRTHLCVYALLLAAACGGGKIDSHEEGIEAKMDLVDDMVSIIESIKDKRSAEAAKPKLDAIEKKMQEIDAQMRALGPADPAAMAKAMESMGKAMEKLGAAMEKVPDDPEIQQVLGGSGMGMGR